MRGATLLANGSTLLLCRVEDRRGISHLCAARSRNGVDGWEIDSERTLMSRPNEYPEEIWGIEDPRHPETSARQTLVCGLFRFLQTQVICT
jgi:beta-1,2-mannobiose phosphorylase / 1,2-beta-oligomannan phosphorylase